MKTLLSALIFFLLAASAAALDCPTGAMKGLIHRTQPDVKYYLVPSHAYYAGIVTLDAARGEQCFATVAEAEQAGFLRLGEIVPATAPIQYITDTVSVTPMPTPIPPVETGCVTQRGFFFAETVADYRTAANYQAQGDTAALNKFIAAKRARWLKSGVSVYIEDALGLFDGTIKIRHPGQLTVYYTATRAVTCQ